MTPGRLWRRLRALGRGPALDREMDEEMRFHLDMEAADLASSGIAADEAQRLALSRFGGVAWHQEAAREARGVLWARDGVADLRYALRTLRRAPVFALTAVLTLALGIGAAATIFAAADAYVFRPLPFPHGDRLVRLFNTHGSSVGRTVSLPTFEAWRAGAQAFDAMAAAAYQGYTYRGAESAEHVMGQMVSAGYFALFGQRPILGREFEPSDDRRSAAPVVIVSRRFWKTRLAGARGAVGRAITLDGRPFTVIGVVAHGLETLATPTEVFLPVEAVATDPDPGHWFLSVYGRLKPGTTLATARADLAVLARRLDERYHWTGVGATAVPLRGALTGDTRGPLLALLAAVGFLLLIAVANLAGLLQARALARSREYAVRAALGAGRGRLFRQAAAETGLVTVLGAAAGVLLAAAGTRLVLALWPASLPRPLRVSLDPRVVAFAVVLAAAAGVVAALAGGGLRLRGAALGERAGSLAGGHVRGVLVAAEVALSLVLLVGSGLMIRSLERLLSVDPGFRDAGVTTFEVSLPEGAYASGARQAAFFDGLLARLDSVPGVLGAGTALNLPLSGTMNGGFTIEGRPWDPATEAPEAVKHIVSPGYLGAMGIPVLRGRGFTEADRAGALPVALVNQAMARRFWPGGDPIGQRIGILGSGWQEIVGVVGDVRVDALDRAPRLETYLPLDQWPSFPTMSVVVRHEPGRGGAVVAAARAAVRAMDPAVPLYRVQPLSQVVAGAAGSRRLPAMLLGAFAGLALLLAAVGLYGLLAYSVSRRGGEIAVRMALGAGAGAVTRRVVAEGMRLVAAGAAAGILLALVLTRLVTGLLFGVRPLDAVSYAVALAALGAAALLACAIPARRAARVDPARALQAE